MVNFYGSANASSICTADTSTTFSCFEDLPAPDDTATGTFNTGATLTQGSNGLKISSAGVLDVVLNGEVNWTSDRIGTSVVHLTAVGPLSYTNNGTASGSGGWLFNTFLQSNESVVASTGNVVAYGLRATAVHSETLNGNNTLTAGNTTVSGDRSRGLWTDAYNGHNVTNTGNVTATGIESRGVIARALPSGECWESPGTTSTTVNVTGNVTAHFVGISTITCGVSTVNVLTGTTVAVTGSHGQAIRNIGNTASNTNIHGSVMAASTAGLALDVREGPSATVIGSTGYLSGTFDGDVKVDTIAIATGGTWISSGMSEFGSGEDAVTNYGTIIADAGTFSNLETLTNEGVLAVEGGSFTLIGSTTFTNNGTIEVSTGETTITSDSALLNNGAIDMQNGIAGDLFTITNGYVAGANASLYIDVSEEVSDTFFVGGGTTGTTAIYVDAPQAINTNGILIGTVGSPSLVRALGGEESQPAMKFSVGNQVTRLIDAKLEQVGNHIFLITVPNALAFQPLLIGQVVRDTWYQSSDVYAANAAQARGEADAARSRPFALWGQVYASEDRQGDRTTQNVFDADVQTDSRARTKRAGVQLGFDVRVGDSMLVGMTGGYQKADAGHRSLDGGVDTDGYNIGAFALFGQSTGVYGSLLVKYDWSDARLTNSAFDVSAGDPDFNSFGAELGAGYRWSSNAVRFDLGASLSHVRTSVDSFSAEGIAYNFHTIKSVRGSLDARAEFGNGKIVPFVNARLLREFDGDSTLTLASGDESDQVTAKGKRTWARLEAGINGKGGSGPLLSGWAEVGEVQGLGVRGGWRF